MPYVAAKNWKGQTLPPGALGYPPSHPNVYSYARPRYIAGRGFSGLGRSGGYHWRRRGIGQASSTTCSMTALPQCTEGDIAAQNILGSWAVSNACTSALAACSSKLVATPPPPVALTPPSTPGVGVQVGCNCVTDPNTGAITTSPCAAGQVPSAADYACVAQQVSNAQVKAQQALNAAQVQTVACPYLTDVSGNCCSSNQALDSDGNCSTLAGIPAWGWYAIAAAGLLVLVKI